MGIGDNQLTGLLPRVIQQVFDKQAQLREQKEVTIKVSFLEIYNEDIYDLLDFSNHLKRTNSTTNNSIGIREERDGTISVYGA